ncbi:MAG: OsmC family protein [Cyclobacteriaceae bacterium]
MEKLHHYTATISWKGNLGKGTLDYKAYSRDHDIAIEGKPLLHASSDAAFRGDKSKVTPEYLLVSSLSGCHMLWYLHLCAINGVVVTDYLDHAVGEMAENQDGSGQFTKVTLHPLVTVTEFSMVEKAKALHNDAHYMCFIARSVNFPLYHIPEVNCYEKA